MNKLEFKFFLTEKIYIEICNWIYEISNNKSYREKLKSYYFANIDDNFTLVENRHNELVVKIRIEEKHAFLYCKGLVKNDNSILYPQTDNKKVEIGLFEAEQYRVNGLSKEILSNILKINVACHGFGKAKMPCVGIVENTRIKYKHDNSIMFIVDKYNILDKIYYVLEIQIEDEIAFNNASTKTIIRYVLGKFHISDVKFSSKREELFTEINKKAVLQLFYK